MISKKSPYLNYFYVIAGSLKWKPFWEEFSHHSMHFRFFRSFLFPRGPSALMAFMW